MSEVRARTGAEVACLTRREEVSQACLAKLAPDWVFFPHWSHIVPAEVYENFRCVIFHMTDLPYGRGGSPLQNLIVRGVYETQVTALQCVKELDAGPIYMKRPLSLWGTAEEIYLRSGDLVKEMMIELVRDAPEPVPQAGEATVFRRRRPEEGDLCACKSLAEVFDYIRMLDAEGYPNAFLDVGNMHLEFSRASRGEDTILADVRIRWKEKGKEPERMLDDGKEHFGRSSTS